MTTRVTAGPYTLELPSNGVAVLYEADEGGNEHQLPGGVGYLDALIQFAGEVIRLQAMVGQMQTDHVDQKNVALRSCCDVCGATDRPTATIIAYGIETNACDQCRGEDDGDQ